MHTSVLLHETLDRLAIQKGNSVLDATLGGAGHSEEICKRFGKDVHIIGLDADSDAIERAQEKLSECTTTLVESNFRYLDTVLDTLKVQHIDRALFDLGISSFQLEESGRGLSFLKDEPLSMRFTKDGKGITAKDIVNNWNEDDLVEILEKNGEERFAQRIAQGIVATRKDKQIETTTELVAIIKKAVPAWYTKRRLHFATKTFQALRMAVNDEEEALTEGLTAAFNRLSQNGRLAVISFHSGEDRIVKQFFKTKVTEGNAVLVNKRVIVPSRNEIQRNPRARSAKLRIIQKII